MTAGCANAITLREPHIRQYVRLPDEEGHLENVFMYLLSSAVEQRKIKDREH